MSLIDFALRDRNERNIVYGIIKSRSNLTVGDLIIEANRHNICDSEVRKILRYLRGRGQVYEPHPGVIELVEY